MDLSIITVTHHSRDYIEDLVFSVMMSCFSIHFEHIIIDNASKDGTAEYIENHFAEHVTLIKNEENVGFSRANNQALQIARGRFLLFLNPDMCVKQGNLDHFIQWMDANPDVGLAGCKLLDPLGKESMDGRPKAFPNLSSALLWLVRLDSLFRREQIFLDTQSPQDVEAVKGAFLLVRREVVQKLGWGFDPRYFLLFEDTDLCREVHKLGYRNVYYPDLACIDYISRSFSIKSGKWIYREFTKSMLKYFRKWHPWYQWMCVALLIPLGFLFRIFFKRKSISF